MKTYQFSAFLALAMGLTACVPTQIQQPSKASFILQQEHSKNPALNIQALFKEAHADAVFFDV